jgi:isoleucyl-tRNA synthetase
MEILNVLVRMMAPILSFTADEIWQYMKDDSKQPSVHIELFSPVKEPYKDPELSARWEDLIAVRKEVTKALEMARKERKIGHALDASVTLGLSPQLMSKMKPYEDQLRSLFIVSSVSLTDVNELSEIPDSDGLPGLRVSVAASSDPKCERCWVHDPTVGHNEKHPTICKRCLMALAEME